MKDEIKEIERLNNIIDELEKIVKEQEDKIIIEKGQTDNEYNYDLCDSEISAYEYVLNKLKELKGADK